MYHQNNGNDICNRCYNKYNQYAHMLNSNTDIIAQYYVDHINHPITLYQIKNHIGATTYEILRIIGIDMISNLFVPRDNLIKYYIQKLKINNNKKYLHIS